MKPIYYPPAYLLSRILAYQLKRSYRRLSDLRGILPEGILRILQVTRRHMLSRRRCQWFDLCKYWMAAYFIEPGSLVIDAGAHVGKYSAYCASLVGPKGEVRAYEAHPLIFQRLSEEVKRYQNILCSQVAVSRLSGQLVEMNIYPDDWTKQSSTLEPQLMNEQRMPGNTQRIQVPTQCLDALLSEGKHCSWIKIDVEGHEHAVIEGAKTLIEQQQPVILYEYGYQEGVFEPKTIPQLLDLGYVSYDCATLHQVFEGYSAVCTDLIAIPKERQKEFESLTSFLSNTRWV